MRSHRFAQAIAATALLVAAVAGGFFATNAFQTTVAIVPGVQGCWRLEGTARQTECLSDEFRDGAAESADGLSGAERSRAINTYVGRADRLAADDERLGGVCHPAMHQLGRDEGTRAASAGSAPAFPDNSTQLCTAGYVHGLAEGYLVGTPDADVARVFPELCHEVAARSGCAHGVGHALLRSQESTGWSSAVPAAVQRCGDLPDEWPADCHDGVYMELAMRTKPEPVPVDRYVDACRVADDTGDAALGLSCWGYLGLSLTSNDVPVEDSPDWCTKASGSGEFTCIEGYGRDLGVQRVAECRADGLRTVLVQRCIEGAIGLQVGSGHVTPAAARSACGSLTGSTLVTYCRDAVGRYAAGRAAATSAEHDDAAGAMTGA